VIIVGKTIKDILYTTFMGKIVPLTPMFDLTFSEKSYGFRLNRRAQDPVRKAKGYIKEGYR
jgi:retron-type reverse transcriptase